MPRNGNGEFDLPAGNPVIPGTVIESSWANNTMNDLAAALTDSIAADGQTTPIANLPMGGYHHTGVSNPTLRNQYATLGMSQDGLNTRVQITGGVDNIVGTLVGQGTTYVAGALVSFFAPATNTGAMTLNYNGIGARSIVSADGNQLLAGEVQAGSFYMALYNGSAFVLVSSTTNSNVNLYQASTTGWIRPVGGQYPVLTIATATTVNVPAGEGYIVPPGIDGETNAVKVSWSAQTIVLSYVNSAFITTVTVNAAGQIIQYSGPAIGSALRTNAIIGIVQHVNGAASIVQTQPSVFGDDGYLSRATSSLLTGNILSGLKITPNGVAPLQLDVSSGLIFQPGASSDLPDSPNTLVVPGQANITFRTLAGESTVGGAILTNAPVTQYDPNGAGVVATIPQNGDAVIHRLYYLYGQFIWVFGQFIYANVATALNYIEVDRTDRITSTRLAGATLLAEIIATKATVNLTSATAEILAKGAVFFSIGSSGGIGEAPVNGTAYGRQDATWVPVVKGNNPSMTGTATLTGTSPTMTQVLSTPGSGSAGYIVKQGVYDWASMTPVAADDKTYFRSYNPLDGLLRSTTTWDLEDGSWSFGGNAYTQLPSGTSAQRPTGANGMMRYNTDLFGFEGYANGSWGSIGGGATGGGQDKVFYENAQVVTANYTLTAGQNAMSAGPITINSGVTVTIPTGATWSIV